MLPLLYLPGLSSSDFGPALEHFLGSVTGLSVAIITRLTGGWHDEAEAFDQRSLSDTDYVYVWVDGIVRREALCNRVRVKGPRRLVVVATTVSVDGRLWDATPHQWSGDDEYCSSCGARVLM